MKTFSKCVGVAALAVACLAAWAGEPSKSTFPDLSGPYLGQKPPGKEPELFAPGIVSTGMFTRDVAIAPDGGEIYWTVTIGSYAYTTIVFSKQVKGRWTPPEVVPFAQDPSYHSIEPCISWDGQRMFFVSDRPQAREKEAEGKKTGFDVWVVDRKGDGWGEPRSLGAPVNTEADEYFPSVTKGGTLYFTRQLPDGTCDIMRARWQDGRYSEPEKLPKQVNCGTVRFNAFAAPDESYLLVPAVGREDSLGGADYYAVFRNPDDTWSEPVNLGPKINTKGSGEYSPYVSRDGKIFFFMSSRADRGPHDPGERLTYHKLCDMHVAPGNGNAAVWWVDAAFLHGLRPSPQARPSPLKP